jgi:hypothetical protein
LSWPRICGSPTTIESRLGVASLETIERIGEHRCVDLAVDREKAHRFVDRARRIGRYADDLDTVAGRNQRGLCQSGSATLQARKRRDDFAAAIGQPLADRDRGGAMIDSDDEELFVHPIFGCARPGVSRNSHHVCPERAGSRLRTNLTTR